MCGSEGSGEPRPDLWLRSHSGPPPTILPLMMGGGGPIWVVFQCGPLCYRGTSSLHRPPPLATCVPLGLLSTSHITRFPLVSLGHTHLPLTLVAYHFPVSLPLVFPHLSLSLSRRPIIGDVFPFDKSHPTTVSPWPPQDLPHSSSGLSSSHFHI
jgi:hypothetical protein